MVKIKNSMSFDAGNKLSRLPSTLPQSATSSFDTNEGGTIDPDLLISRLTGSPVVPRVDAVEIVKKILQNDERSRIEPRPSPVGPDPDRTG